VRQPPLDGAAAPTRRCGSPHSTGGGGGIGGVVPFVLDRTVKRVIALGAENGFTGRMTPSDGPAAAAVADRLCQRFSEIPTALVHDLVAKSFEQFEGARVRDFIELLVEREVTAALMNRRRGAESSVSA